MTDRETYLALIDMNGTRRNMALRRMSNAELASARDYAETQKPLPFSSRNLIAFDVEREQRKRS